MALLRMFPAFGFTGVTTLWCHGQRFFQAYFAAIRLADSRRVCVLRSPTYRWDLNADQCLSSKPCKSFEIKFLFCRTSWKQKVFYVQKIPYHIGFKNWNAPGDTLRQRLCIFYTKSLITIFSLLYSFQKFFMISFSFSFFFQILSMIRFFFSFSFLFQFYDCRMRYCDCAAVPSDKTRN